MLLDLLLKSFRAGENARGMEGQCGIVPIFKEKGTSRIVHGNYRGIKMIYHTTKIWEKNNPQNIQGEDKLRRRAVRFHAGQRDN